MANEKKGTIYQRLNQLFNFDGTGNQESSIISPVTAPQKSKIIIKGNTPEEIHLKGLELEQKRELQNKFFRTTDRGFQKALQYEAARLPAYIDYEGMEYYPIISSALDLFMEEATTIGLNGKMLNIFSNKERIKSLLEEFFYETVNVNVNLPFWVRNLPIKYDSIIPLLNGEEITIQEISNRLKNNPEKEIWTYSIQNDTKNIVPGKIVWCDLTRKNSELVRINLDDNTFIETTPDHEFMLRNGKYKKANELISGDSLMPFYTLESKKSNYFEGYEKVYNPSTNDYKFTHKIISNELLHNIDYENSVDNVFITHHIDFNKKNISPENLKKITNTEHSKYYSILSEREKKLLQQPDIRKTRNNKNELILNHKVISVEKLIEKSDVYCMEVVGKNNEQDRHNFPVCSKNIDGSYSRNGVFVSNCKYGDNFVLLYGERKKGITHVKQLVNYEIERFERIQNGKPLVRFKERMTGDEFNAFEIAHFRLLGDDKFIPYGSCLLSDSYIKTNNGIKEIKDIQKGDIVIGFDLKTQKQIESNVLDVVCNGEKDVFKISTQHNYIKATHNHKILIYDYSDNEFKYELVSNLKLGDGLIINKFDEYNEKIKINKSIEIKEHNDKIYNDFTNDLKYIPEYVDEDFAKLFGFLLGDGNINIKRPHMVYFTYGAHDTINTKYIELLQKYSGKEIYLRKNKKIASAIVNSKSLATILSNMEFIGDTYTKRIPKWVYSTSKEIRKAFLEGIMDAYGSVDIDKWNCKRFQIELSNYNLINDIKLLAQSLGYKTGNINKRKPRKKDVCIRNNKIINISDLYVLYFYESNNTQIISSDIDNRKTDDFIIEKIKSIEPDGKGFVYDIHVDNENHNFYANNIVVHNSVLNKVRRVFRQCLDSESKIWTPNGYTKISELNINDDIFSYSLNNNKVINSKVSNISNNGIKERFEVKTCYRTIIVTDDHPILTYNEKIGYLYKDINTINKIHDKLVLPSIDKNNINESITDFQKIISIKNIGKGEVWDIEVDNDEHNFIAEGIVVHNCVMAEDAMLTYRIIRAGEKKVFKIDVGNIDEDDIEEYIYKVATTFKKVAQVSPNDGQIDYRFNILGNDEDYFLPVRNANTQTGIETLPGACLALNTKIDLLDGRSLELNDIINEFNSGKKLWTYSINPDNGLIVPGKITWAGVTRKNTDVIKITLDNNESIICTPDHKFPTKFNGFKEAKNLSVGESMWSFNKKFEKIKSGNKKYEKDYEMIYDHSLNDWVYTHRMVRNYLNESGYDNNFIFNEDNKNKDKNIIHHKDFNRYNNNPENLCNMSYIDHFQYHSNIGINNLTKIEMEEKVKKLNDGFYNYYNNLTESQKINRNKNIGTKRKKILNNLSKEEYDQYIQRVTKQINSEKSRNNLKKVMLTPEYKEKMRLNGKKIRSDEKINERIRLSQSFKYEPELLDIVIDFVNNNSSKLDDFVNYINTENNEFKELFIKLNYNKPHYKSFNKFSRKNILKLIRYYNYENWDDFIAKIPCYNHKIINIEWLKEKQDTGTITIDGQHEFHGFHTFALSCGIFTKNSNLDQIADIEYLRDNLFIGLGIPKPFLSFQDAAGAGKNMAQYDIRFAKKINRIQQAMIQELNKMAMIHLFLLGYTGEDLNSFQLTLTNPSTQQEQLKTELFREKAQTYTELTRAEGGIAAMSHTTAKRMIFNMSDREIVDDLKQQKMEKVVMQELQDSPVVIKKSGLFTDIDKRFGEPIEGMPITGETGGNMPPTGGAPTPIGGSEAGIPPMGGVEAGAPIGNAPIGGEVGTPLMETRKKMSDDEYNNYTEKLVFGSTQEPKEKKKNKQKEIIQENNEKNNKLNKNAEQMIAEINQLLDKNESINNLKKITESQEIDIYDIENIDLDE